MKLFFTIIAAVLLTGCGADDQSATKAAVAEVAPIIKLKESRYYAMQDGGEYGYEQAVSADAKNHGQVANKIHMFRYLGERNGVLQFHSRDGSVHAVVQCERPCEFIKQMIFIDKTLQRKEHIRAVEGSIAWGLTHDALNGYLKPFTKERDGKLQEYWFDETGPKWRVVASGG